MSFLDTVERARSFLERHRRVSLRALRREFGLDPEAVAELSDELVNVQHVAVSEGDVLVWTGDESFATTPAAIPSPEREPRAYTPKHLAEKILTSRSALEGERKQVTVLFADVKGSMDLAEQLDPEEWHRILDRFFQILTDGVHRFEGTINQYTGDGIMALFGAPIAHEDHAQRACYAALHVRDELRPYADELRIARGVSFSVRMGLNSGEVVVGKIGEDLRMDYTAQGHTVGLGVDVAERVGSAFSRVIAYNALGRAHLLHEQWSEAVAGFEQAIAIAREHGTGLEWEASILARLAEALCGVEKPAAARVTADQAIAIGRQRRTPFFELEAQLALARVLLPTAGAAEEDAIRTALAEAMALTSSTGAASYEPLVRVELAELARLTGDEATRQRELREAHRLFLEIDAPIRAEQVVKELAG